MERIGVRELRQNASRYLERVAGGETLEITDRGRPVALLVPTSGDPWDDLIASGAVIAPAEPLDILDEAAEDFGIDASRNLAQSREGER